MALTNRWLADLTRKVKSASGKYNKSTVNGRFVRSHVGCAVCYGGDEWRKIRFDGKSFYRETKDIEHHDGILTGWKKQSVIKGWEVIDKNDPAARQWVSHFIRDFKYQVEKRDEEYANYLSYKSKSLEDVKEELLLAHESFNGTWKTNSDYSRMVELKRLFQKVNLTWPSEIVEFIPEARLETFEYVERNAYGDAAVEAEDAMIDDVLSLLGIDDDLEEDEDGDLYHTKSDFKLTYLNPNGFRIQMTISDKLARRVRSILR